MRSAENRGTKRPLGLSSPIARETPPPPPGNPVALTERVRKNTYHPFRYAWDGTGKRELVAILAPSFSPIEVSQAIRGTLREVNQGRSRGGSRD